MTKGSSDRISCIVVHRRALKSARLREKLPKNERGLDIYLVLMG